MISFWYAVPGGAPQLVLAPPVDDVAGPIRGPLLPQRPESIFVLGGPTGGRIRLALEHQGRERWGTVLGEGPAYTLTEAGTAIIRRDWRSAGVEINSNAATR